MRLEVTVRGDRGPVAPQEIPEAWRIPAVLPFGIGTWVTFAYVGVRARRRAWLKASAGYLGAFVAGSAIASMGSPSLTRAAIGVAVWTATWIGGLVHLRRLRPEIRAALGIAGDADRASEEIARRRSAIELSRREPETARELGIGSLGDPHGYGVVDVNAATAEELTVLPGIDPATAERIIALREQLGGFRTLVELAHEANLPAAAPAALQDRVVFLPPQP